MKKRFLLTCLLLCLIIAAANAQYKIILNFNDTNGSAPYGSLTLSGSKLYGMASGAWLNGWGLIFSIDTDGTHYTDIHDFDLTNGAEPLGSLTLSGNKLYGMTYAGGARSGIIFSMDTDGSHFDKLLSFIGTNGAEPYGSLTLSGNKLYGMTSIGGAYNDGLIFSIDTNGSHYKDLLDFDYTNGILPNGSLTLSGSKLYGMAPGGKDSAGLIFSIDTDGSHYKDLLDFNGANGSSPQGSLTLSGNTLYGMTYKGGGAKNAGLVFSIDTNGSHYKNLLDLNIANGYFPYGDLTLSGSTLHGMIYGGGANNKGLIFSIDTNGGHYKDLLDFNGTNGAYPTGNLTLSGNTLYGMTPDGGANNDGIIFSLYVPLNVSISNTFPSCHGNNNGEAIAYASEGKTPYTFKWAPGGSTKDTLTGLSAGTYTVMVTDSSHSTATTSVTITQPSPLQITEDSVNAGKGCDGEAKVNVSGGTSPYTYKWTGGSTYDTISKKCAGTYTCMVTDNNGCTQTVTVTILNTTGENIITPISEQMNIYPNPFTNTTTIAISTGGAYYLEVDDLMGRKLKYVEFTGAQYQLSAQGLAKGLYFIRVFDSNKTPIGISKIAVQ